MFRSMQPKSQYPVCDILAYILLSHRIMFDLPFGLMRLNQGLQCARCGAVANLQERATLLVPDGPYRTDHTRSLQWIGQVGVLAQNSGNVGVAGA